ncbi:MULTISPECIES: VOC family protein [Flavobacteriaceae]|uniref:VOC family protein n=1 Tax=Flavobacteriaceae TaxID=49546 RepID=UPI0014927B2F|nr:MULTISPECIES: VOC family protein [Allomuricauda]MDC6364483.1 VOC family protein [Muricauda sp. AC10]
MANSKKSIAHITLVVRDYDEAIEFYTQKLNFKLVQDVDLGNGKRWVLVAPKTSECALLLGKAANEEQMAAIGNQTGGRVFLFLHTDDFWADYESMKNKGVEFTEKPRKEEYGTVVVFKDLYGNLWDLLQLN